MSHQLKFKESLRAVGGATGIKTCLEHGNDAPLDIVLQAAAEDIDHLSKFKAYVHAWLDDNGVPTDPDPDHNRTTGCRLRGRLNWLKAKQA